MNKTINFKKEKINLSLVEKPRPHNVKDQSVDRSRIQVCMENSNAEKYAGMNISYENSFSAIKKDILKETVDKKRQAAMTKEVEPIMQSEQEFEPEGPPTGRAEEKRGSIEEGPRAKRQINNSKVVASGTRHHAQHSMAQDFNSSLNVEDLLNRTGQYASTRSGRKSNNDHKYPDFVNQDISLNHDI